MNDDSPAMASEDGGPVLTASFGRICRVLLAGLTWRERWVDMISVWCSPTARRLRPAPSGSVSFFRLRQLLTQSDSFRHHPAPHSPAPLGPVRLRSVQPSPGSDRLRQSPGSGRLRQSPGSVQASASAPRASPRRSRQRPAR